VAVAVAVAGLKEVAKAVAVSGLKYNYNSFTYHIN